MTDKEIMDMSDREFLKFVSRRWPQRSAVRRRLYKIAMEKEKVVSVKVEGTVS